MTNASSNFSDGDPPPTSPTSLEAPKWEWDVPLPTELPHSEHLRELGSDHAEDEEFRAPSEMEVEAAASAQPEEPPSALEASVPPCVTPEPSTPQDASTASPSSTGSGASPALSAVPTVPGDLTNSDDDDDDRSGSLSPALEHASSPDILASAQAPPCPAAGRKRKEASLGEKLWWHLHGLAWHSHDVLQDAAGAAGAEARLAMEGAAAAEELLVTLVLRRLDFAGGRLPAHLLRRGELAARDWVELLAEEVRKAEEAGKRARGGGREEVAEEAEEKGRDGGGGEAGEGAEGGEGRGEGRAEAPPREGEEAEAEAKNQAEAEAEAGAGAAEEAGEAARDCKEEKEPTEVEGGGVTEVADAAEREAEKEGKAGDGGVSGVGHAEQVPEVRPETRMPAGYAGRFVLTKVEGVWQEAAEATEEGGAKEDEAEGGGEAGEEVEGVPDQGLKWSEEEHIVHRTEVRGSVGCEVGGGCGGEGKTEGAGKEQTAGEEAGRGAEGIEGSPGGGDPWAEIRRQKAAETLGLRECTRVEAAVEGRVPGFRVWTLVGFDGEREVARVSEDLGNNRAKLQAFERALRRAGFALGEADRATLQRRLHLPICPPAWVKNDQVAARVTAATLTGSLLVGVVGGLAGAVGVAAVSVMREHSGGGAATRAGGAGRRASELSVVPSEASAATTLAGAATEDEGGEARRGEAMEAVAEELQEEGARGAEGKSAAGKGGAGLEAVRGMEGVLDAATPPLRAESRKAEAPLLGLRESLSHPSSRTLAQPPEREEF